MTTKNKKKSIEENLKECIVSHLHKIRNKVIWDKREFREMRGKVKIETVRELLDLIYDRGEISNETLNDIKSYLESIDSSNKKEDWVQDLRGALNEVILHNKSMYAVRKHLKDLMSAQKASKDLISYLNDLSAVMDREVPSHIIKYLKDLEKIMKDKSKDVIKHLEHRHRSMH